LIGKNVKRLLIIDCALSCILVAVLLTLVFSPYYAFHFQEVTLNYYANGSTDFTANAASLVRSFAGIALFLLVFGVITGAAIGLDYGAETDTFGHTTLSSYEGTITKLGFVEINQMREGTTYRLTDRGRRFLREYRFLEKTEEATV